MKVPPSMAAKVRQRAVDSCEYCRMSQRLQGAAFHIEHIVPLAHGGKTRLDNLALACPGCNLRKSDRISAEDPGTGMLEPLFHPRNHAWNDHFQWRGTRMEGISGSGRATVSLLQLNHPRRLLIRNAEKRFGLFPPG